jgi:hypothetical protein
VFGRVHAPRRRSCSRVHAQPVAANADTEANRGESSQASRNGRTSIEAARNALVFATTLAGDQEVKSHKILRSGAFALTMLCSLALPALAQGAVVPNDGSVLLFRLLVGWSVGVIASTAFALVIVLAASAGRWARCLRHSITGVSRVFLHLRPRAPILTSRAPILGCSIARAAPV